MKKYALILSVLVLAASMTGCAKHSDSDAASSETGASAETQSAENGEDPPFEEYTAEVTDGSANYLLTLSRGEKGITAVLEDNSYQASFEEILPPDGFEPLYPGDSASAGDICRIITNDIDDKPVPDLIRFDFTDGENEVSRFYMISGGKFVRLKIYESADSDAESDYLARTSLYHSEPLKFISGIIVDESAGITDNINDMVRIRTLSFDPKKQSVTCGYEELSPDDPLYFGYAYWGLANNTARYFTENVYNISDYDDYREEKNPDDPENPYYFFKIDDSRFSDTDGLEQYLRSIFSESLARSLISSSPQKYHDIDGELYALTGQSRHDYSLGMLTFRSYRVSEDGEKITYYTRQEKYDENGKFIGYTDGGDFQLSYITDWIYHSENNEYEDVQRWVVTMYRYPYS